MRTLPATLCTRLGGGHGLDSDLALVSVLVRDSLVSPMTFRGDEPSAWCADWELFEILTPSFMAVELRIRFPVAPLSIMMRMEIDEFGHGVWKVHGTR